MKVAILGLGTVGSGVLKVIQDNQALIKERIGEPLEVTHIFGRTINNYHDCDLTGIKHEEDIEALLESDIELVIEVLGGIDFTYEIHKKFLSRGIHVVSANKDMLALHIDELAQIANENQAQLSYEASSAGGIPIISSLQYGLDANKITRILGIFNGTTNYILTKMTKNGMEYETALAEAQEKGYAESDPTNDVEGFDAQRKITLLSRLAYGKKIDLQRVPVKGISDVSIQDIEIAKENNFVMKLLGVSEYDGEHLEISVEPALLPVTHQLASVDDAMNGVFVNGNAVGETMFYGPGAGSLETASAIVSDVMNIVRFGFVGNFAPSEEAAITSKYIKHPYYLRFNESPEHVQNILSDEKIKYRVLLSDIDFTVQTEAISHEDVKRIQERLDITSAYEMLGVDK
jgi:homoserine dehydrogenase